MRTKRQTLNRAGLVAATRVLQTLVTQSGFPGESPLDDRIGEFASEQGVEVLRGFNPEQMARLRDLRLAECDDAQGIDCGFLNRVVASTVFGRATVQLIVCTAISTQNCCLIGRIIDVDFNDESATDSASSLAESTT